MAEADNLVMNVIILPLSVSVMLFIFIPLALG